MFAFRNGNGVQAWSIAWLDSSSKMKPLLSKPVMYDSPRFSPDGRKLAIGIDNGKGMDLFIHDFERDTTSPLTFNPKTNTDAIWAPHAAHLVFRSRSSRTWALWWIRADGAGGPQPLASGEIEDLSANALSPKGDRLIYGASDRATDSDIWVIPIEASDPDHPKAGPSKPFLAHAGQRDSTRLLPRRAMGRLLVERYGRHGSVRAAFRNARLGERREVEISTTGGFFPIWSRSGRELFYLSPENRIMVSDFVVRNNSFVASRPRLWSSQQLLNVGYTNLDLAPDGKRFAILPAPATRTNVRLTVLLNFFDELRRRVP